MFCAHCGKQIQKNISFCPNCGKHTSIKADTKQVVSTNSYGPVSSATRFLNSIIDQFILTLALIIIVAVSDTVIDEEAINGLVIFILFFGYNIFFEGIWQRTPAKWITKCKVVCADGSIPNFWKILGRSFARYIPFEPLSFLASPVGWHDSLSGTLVVPSSYTSDEVKQIDPTNASKSKLSTPIIIVICFFVGIFLIGLLSSVVLLSLNSAREKSRDAKRVADVRQIASGLELFYNDFDRYPHSLSELAPNYLDTIPETPIPNDGNCSSEQNRYSYSYITNQDYKLSFCLGAATGGISAGIHNLTPLGIDEGVTLNVDTPPQNQDIQVTNSPETPTLVETPVEKVEEEKIVQSWLDSTLNGWAYDEGKPYKISLTFMSINDPSYTFTATSSSSIYGNSTYSVGGGCGGICYQDGSFLWSSRVDAAKSLSSKGVKDVTVAGFQFSASGYANTQPNIPKDDYVLIKATFNGKSFNMSKDIYTVLHRVCAYGQSNYYLCYN